MKKTHAPGPWRLHLVDDTTIIDANGRFVASVCGGDDDLGDVDYNNPDEWPILEANANLVAASWSFYQAAKLRYAYFEMPINSDGFDAAFEAWRTMEAQAMAIAEGRPLPNEAQDAEGR